MILVILLHYITYITVIKLGKDAAHCPQFLLTVIVFFIT